MAPYARTIRRPALDLDRMAKMAREHVAADASCVYVARAVPPFAASARGDHVADAAWFETLIEQVVTIGRAQGTTARSPLHVRSHTFVLALCMPDNTFVGAIGVGARREREWTRVDLQRLLDIGRFVTRYLERREVEPRPPGARQPLPPRTRQRASQR